VSRISIEPSSARGTADRLRAAENELHSVGARVGSRRLPSMPPSVAGHVEGQLARQRANFDQRGYDLGHKSNELIRRAAIAEIAGGDATARSFVDLAERGGLSSILGPEGVLFGLLTPKLRDVPGFAGELLRGAAKLWDRNTFVKAAKYVDKYGNLIDRRGTIRNLGRSIKSHSGTVRALGRANRVIGLADSGLEIADAWRNPHGKSVTESVSLQVGEEAGEIGGGMAGAAGGAWAGAAAGAAIGSVVPIAGTAVGAGVGLVVGSVAGGWVGSKIGGPVGRGLTDTVGKKLKFW
jgi:hypothetical protein